MATDLTALRRAAGESRIDWQPGETAHAGMSVLRARSRLGAMPPGGAVALQLREQAALAQLAAGAPAVAGVIATAPPAKFDWRDVSGANYVSAVRDQAGCGSCVAFGTTAVLESMVRIAAKEPALDVDLSEAYAFFCLGPHHGAGSCPDGGWWPDDALTAMKAGITDEANYPYTDDDQPCRRGADWATRLTTFSSWTRKTSVTAMKSYLATHGPMTACFTVYEDFFYYYTSGIYTYHSKTSGDDLGGHCVQIVGYDDATKCWIAKNSWGTGWGEDGYFRIAYGSAGIDAEMWGIDGTIGSPLIRTTLQVVATGTGNVWQVKRGASGTWQKAVTRLDTGTQGDPGKFTAVTAAATINRLHVAGLVGGVAWYTRRRTGAKWARWAKPTSSRPSGAGPWQAISCAAAGDTVHVVALSGGAIWHTRRTPSGSWQQAWKRITPATGGPGPFTALACVAVGTAVKVVAIAGGSLWLTGRHSDGSWTAPAPIAPSDNQVPGTFTAVGAATVDGRLNLVALSGGVPWHLERGPGNTWGTFRELASTNPAAAAAFDAVACADVGRELHVLALSGGVLWRTGRKADGTWQASFGSVGARVAGEPAILGSVDGA